MPDIGMRVPIAGNTAGMEGKVYAEYQYWQKRHRRAVICQGHAPVDAGEQLHAQFLFQPRHHLADAGLGIVQCLRCFGKTARFAHFQEYLVSVFLFPHLKYSISKIYRS